MDKRIILLLTLTLLLGCSKTPDAPTDASVLLPATAAPPTIYEIPTGIPAPEAAGKIYEVEISDFAFNPAELTINKGDSVQWKNKDKAPHTITSINNKELDSGNLATLVAYSHRFETPGTYEYYCSIHPSMKGKIQVR